MKALVQQLALATILLTAVQAKALIQIPGTFSPTQCGPQVYEASESAAFKIESVCLGGVAGEPGDAVEFRMVDGSSKVFRVQSSSNFLVALKSGNVKSNFYLIDENGVKTTMRVIQDRSGRVISVAGALNEVAYLVPQLEAIFSIQ